jgi:hypothetical protein
MYSWLKYRRVAGGLSSAGIDAMSTEGVDVRARRLLNRAAAGQETNGGVGVDAIDSRLELAIACRFATWVNSWRWLAALDDFRNWMIREVA